MGVIHPSHRKTTMTGCERCNLKPECLPSELSGTRLVRFERELIRQYGPIERGAALVRQGDPMHSLYTLYSGSLKETVIQPNGAERVLGFRFPGAIIGLAEPDQKNWTRKLIALEITWYCEIPIRVLDDMMNRHLIRLMRNRLLAEYETHLTAMASGTCRVASFLLHISTRITPGGQRIRHFRLPMPYSDIANHLRLWPESLSRIFKQLSKQGLILKSGHQIELVDVESLRLMTAMD